MIILCVVIRRSVGSLANGQIRPQFWTLNICHVIVKINHYLTCVFAKTLSSLLWCRHWLNNIIRFLDLGHNFDSLQSLSMTMVAIRVCYPEALSLMPDVRPRIMPIHNHVCLICLLVSYVSSSKIWGRFWNDLNSESD